MVATGIVLLCFGAIYLLLSVPRFGSRHLDRATIALAGGALFVAIGAVAPADAVRAIHLDTLLLLIGMMLHVAALGQSGFFPWLASRLVAWSGTARRLLVAEMVAVAVLSALVLNDTVVVLFTPVLVHAARSTGVRPAPFLIGEALAANIGSVATPVGNPQNAFIASYARLDFFAWMGHLALPAGLALAVAILMLMALFGRALAPGGARHPEALPVELDARQARTSVVVLALTFPALALLSRADWSLGLIALTTAGAHLLIVGVLHRVDGPKVVRSVNWGIILLFMGLFVLLRGVTNSGVLDDIAPLVATETRLAATTFVFSNVVSNVPAVLAIAPSLAGAAESTWHVLAAISTLAGNALPLGAAANVIVFEIAAGMGTRVGFWEFARVGLPVAIVTCSLALMLL